MLKNWSANEIIFEMKCAGELKVKKCVNQDQLELDFSAGDLQSIEFGNQILKEIKSKLNISSTRNFSCSIMLFLAKQKSIYMWYYCYTHFTNSRFYFSFFFTLWCGIREDPVTDSACCLLVSAI